MAEETSLVAVVIPVYKSHLSDQDRISLNQTYKVLARYPMIVVHPEGLDLSEFRRDDRSTSPTSAVLSATTS